MTLSDWIDRVETLINQDLSGDTKTVTRSEVIALLNTGYRKLVNNICNAGLDYYMVESLADLVASQSVYNLPSTCRKLERLEVSYSDGITFSRTRKIDRNAPSDPTISTSSNAYPMYALVGKSFELFPTPTTNVTNGLKLWYIKDITDLSADSDVPNLPNGLEHIPPLYAVAMAKIKLGLLNEGNSILGQYLSEIEEGLEVLTPRDEGQPEYVIIRDDMYI